MLWKLQVMIKDSYKSPLEGLHAQRFTRWGFAHGPSLMESPSWRRPCSCLGRCSVCVWGDISHLTSNPDALVSVDVTGQFSSFLSSLSVPSRLYLCLLNPSFYSGLHFILRLLFSNLNLAIRGNGPESSLGQMIWTLKSRTRAQTPFPGVYLSSFSTLSCCRLDLYFGREVGYGSWDGDVVQPPPWEGRTPVTILLEGDMGQAPPAAGGHFGRWVV